MRSVDEPAEREGGAGPPGGRCGCGVAVTAWPRLSGPACSVGEGPGGGASQHSACCSAGHFAASSSLLPGLCEEVPVALHPHPEPVTPASVGSPQHRVEVKGVGAAAPVPLLWGPQPSPVLVTQLTGPVRPAGTRTLPAGAACGVRPWGLPAVCRAAWRPALCSGSWCVCHAAEGAHGQAVGAAGGKAGVKRRAGTPGPGCPQAVLSVV